MRGESLPASAMAEEQADFERQTPRLAEAESDGEDPDGDAETQDTDQLLYRDWSVENRRFRAKYLRICKATGVVVLLLIVFIGGYLCGHFIHLNKTSSSSASSVDYAEIRRFIINEISNNKIQNYLKYFTGFPHIGGSTESHVQAVAVANEWRSYGFGKVKTRSYSVLLSYPTRPGLVSLKYHNGSVIHKAAQWEKVLEKSENDSRVVPPYTAYSASGNVSAPLVYVNYGRLEDFLKLQKYNISCSGRIAIVKYGKLFRGDKVKHAERFNCLGLIMYTDPIDFAPVGTDPQKLFPHSWWLPSSGVQRGTILTNYVGDPLTPGYPSNGATYREPMSKLRLPQIPVYPMSWADAAYFLRSLDGVKAPDDWQGGIPDLVYNMNMKANSTICIVMNISMTLERKSIDDVFWFIEGSHEPDRLVLLGNHRDAWVFGGADPSSGTAALMEGARAVSMALKKGWKPKRSLVFCSWGAEEFGLMGSTEWFEDNFKVLSNEAVAYINVDQSVKGTVTPHIKASPLLASALYESAKEVVDPSGNSTLFDIWLKHEADKERPHIPWIGALGSGSDYTVIYDRIGIPSADLGYYDNSFRASSTPVYHSIHDTFFWMKTFVDPEFKINQAVSRLWIDVALRVADSDILPFNCTRYAEDMLISFQKTKQKYGQLLAEHSITLDHLQNTINGFMNSTIMFHFSKLHGNEPLLTRRLNDKLMALERAFVNPEGLPGRPLVRHMIFAPSANDQYSGSSFPGLIDAIAVAKQSGDWELVKKQVSVLDYFIQQATKVLSLSALSDT